MLELRRRSALSATDGMEERHAVATIVRDHHRSVGAHQLTQVELDELFVSSQTVAPPVRLVRESIAREVERAHAERRAQLLSDLEPVDAASRPAMDEQQHGSV